MAPVATRTDRRARRLLIQRCGGYACSTILLGTVVPQSAQAGSAAQPGQTIGLPTGDQLPHGIYLLDTSSIGERSTQPFASTTNVNLPTLAWSTPFLTGKWRLHLFFTQPVVNIAPQRTPWRGGTGQQLYAGQVAYDLGHDFGVSYLLGTYLPSQTPFVTQSASLSHRVAFSYTGDGYNLTANFLYGDFINNRSPTGTYYPNYLNLDLTATKTFGKWQIGPVGYGSTDLTGPAEYKRQGQFALGGLVGYDFGRAKLQLYVTRDVVERNYRGYETRGWARLIVPFLQDPKDVEPNRILVTRRQGE